MGQCCSSPSGAPPEDVLIDGQSQSSTTQVVVEKVLQPPADGVSGDRDESTTQTKSPDVLETPQEDSSAAPGAEQVDAKQEEKQEEERTSKKAVPERRFIGRWVLTRVDGNMDQFMTDMGLPWAIRRLAKSMDYGTGKTFATICFDVESNVLKIAMQMPKGEPQTTEVVVGGDWQENWGHGGKTVLRKASWEENVLFLEAKDPDGKKKPSTRRWIDPKSGEMIVKLAVSKGDPPLQYFSKQ